ncbi:DUF721 domain-containing protein [Chelatococcus reniformis]|uniref:DUF721 domain-containing protein n=1 Tax=Chelatococcus reniformis TaxID=1494448 RepID=A0A916XDJ3_9HYPH|nr:DciA family protein [Chelatococcus reniformis]GGC62710.1 hypothetical protein GCM10010994_21630 [Chelatococcus reniformis]
MRPPFRSRGAAPLADMVDACLGPALAAQGFAAADVVVAWADIVGPRLAAHTQPLRIEWPRRARDGDDPARAAALIVRSTSAFALELQHMAPVVIERVNTHFGWRCVGRIVIRQGLVARPAPRPQPRGPDPAAAAAVRDLTADIEAAPLREALRRLGEAVLSTPRAGAGRRT